MGLGDSGSCAQGELGDVKRKDSSTGVLILSFTQVVVT